MSTTPPTPSAAAVRAAEVLSLAKLINPASEEANPLWKQQAAAIIDAEIRPLLEALELVRRDFGTHGKSVANYSDGEYTQDYTTRSEVVNAALRHAKGG